VDLSARLTAGGTGVSGKMLRFTLNGADLGASPTDASGLAKLGGVSLAGIAGGSYPSGVAASFAGDAGYAASAGSNTLTVNRANQTIAFDALPSKVFGDADFTVSATATSGLAVGFSAGGACTVSGSTVHMAKVGACALTASQAGSADYEPAPEVIQSFAVAYASCPVAAEKDRDDDERDRADDDRDAKAPKAGSTVQVRLTLCSATGANLSSPTVMVTAVGLREPATAATAPVEDAGNANPGNRFRFDRDLARGGGYVFKLSTKRLSPGTWELSFTASGDSTTHTLVFALR
jgi:hypothetical protein